MGLHSIAPPSPCTHAHGSLHYIFQEKSTTSPPSSPACAFFAARGDFGLTERNKDDAPPSDSYASSFRTRLCPCTCRLQRSAPWESMHSRRFRSRGRVVQAALSSPRHLCFGFCRETSSPCQLSWPKKRIERCVSVRCHTTAVGYCVTPLKLSQVDCTDST